MQVIESSIVLTKDAAAQLLGLKVYDTALPQQWLDDACLNLRIIYTHQKDLYSTILSGTVWCYDQSLFGEPVALTEQALDLLTKIAEIKGHEPPRQESVIRFQEVETCTQ